MISITTPISMIAAVHFRPGIVVPIACVVAVAVLVYWRRLGSPEVPVSRRWIRRGSLGAMLLSLPLLVAGLSFVDPQRSGPVYVLVWVGAMSLVVLVLALAVVDAMNTVRVSRGAHRDLIISQATELYADRRGAASEDGE